MDEEYEDEGESGATTGNRPGLQQLLYEAGAKEFNMVVMYDLSRITRGGTGDFWVLVKQLEAKGVRVE